MDIKASIDDTRKGFEESFASGDFYNRQTQDKEHLERILPCLWTIYYFVVMLR